MTESEAIALGETKFWEGMSHRDIAWFQMFEPLLCMPFSVFHEAVEKTLGRPVFTHEFASPGLKDELRGHRPAPTFSEILELIPAEKRTLVTFTPDAAPSA